MMLVSVLVCINVWATERDEWENISVTIGGVVYKFDVNVILTPGPEDPYEVSVYVAGLTDDAPEDIVIQDYIEYDGEVFDIEFIQPDVFRENTNIRSIDLGDVKSLNAFYFKHPTLKHLKGRNLSQIYNGQFVECPALESIEITGNQLVLFPDCYPLENCVWDLFGAYTPVRSITMSDVNTQFLGYTKKNLPYDEQTYYLGFELNKYDCLPPYAFNKCTTLEEVNIAKCRVWWSKTFVGCKNMHSLTFSKDLVTLLYDNVAVDCGLTEIHCLSAYPPLCIEGGDPLNIDKATCVLYVPAGCRDIYANARYWGEFANIIEVPEVIPGVEMTQVPPLSVDARGIYHPNEDGETVSTSFAPYYYNDGQYTSIYNYRGSDIAVPEKPVTIDGKEYRVTGIADFTGRGCTQINKLTLPEGVETIGREAFAATANERHMPLVLPATMKHIGEGAFDGSTQFSDVTCHAVVPPVIDGDRFFTDAATRSQMTLYVPQEAVEAYRSAPVWQDFDIQTILGVSDIAADSADVPATYYNMQGIRVEAPAHGLYIRRDADGTARVVRL